RLRLLASGARLGDRRHDRRESGGQCEDGAGGDCRHDFASAVRADVRLRQRARPRDPHTSGRDSRGDQARARADHRQVHQVATSDLGPRTSTMSIVVTGSIAFDYLMSFPGKFTEHFLPEHMNRVSLSFLVDTMDKRRGGCAPNIAYTLALLG